MCSHVLVNDTLVTSSGEKSPRVFIVNGIFGKWDFRRKSHIAERLPRFGNQEFHIMHNPVFIQGEK